MNMNKEAKQNIILSVKEYFEVISWPEEKVEEFLSDPKNNIAFTNFKDTIRMAEELDNGNGIDNEGGILPKSAGSILQEYQKEIAKLLEKENKTTREEALISKYYKEPEQEVVPIRTRTKENNYEMPTNKAGYIDATVILIMLLNIGFILAMTILGNR